MIGFNRRGACPSLSEPMQTGDGLLVRLVLDTPELTADQLISALSAGRKCGNGLVEITSRGNLQFRGLTERSAVELSNKIDPLDLSHGGIPITVPALAGIDCDEVADPRPLVNAIRRAINTDLRNRLAPKTSIVIDSGGQLPIDGIAADIRVTATCVDEKTEFWIAIGGNAATARPVCLASEKDVPTIVVNLLERIAKKGLTARGRDLTADGLDEFASAPRKMDRRTNLRRIVPIGRFALSNETFAVGIGLPFGAAQLEGLIDLIRQARAAGANSVRLAPGRGFLFTGLSQQTVGEVIHIAERLGFVTQPDDPCLAISACAGAPLCASGEFETRHLAAKICQTAAPLFDGSFTLHLSGCAKRCADVAGPRLTVLGKSGRCNLLPEFGTSSKPLTDLDPNSLPDLFSGMANSYRDSRKTGETALEFIRRQTIARFAPEELE